MDYVRRLVQLGYIDESAIEIVQSKRDPPSHGIGLVGVGAGQG
jgi:Fe2+ transport system protein FeoA